MVKFNNNLTNSRESPTSSVIIVEITNNNIDGGDPPSIDLIFKFIIFVLFFVLFLSYFYFSIIYQ